MTSEAAREMRAGRAVIAAAMAATACGPALPDADSAAAGREPPPIVELDPIRVTATERDGTLETDAYDAAELFRRAAVELRAGRCEDAVSLYRRLEREFPGARQVVPGLYNSGVCLDQLGRHHEAAQAYQRILEHDPAHRDAADALFRLGESCERSGEWAAAAAAYDRVLNGYELRGIERVEAQARKGAALRRHGDILAARLALEEAARTYRRGRGISPADPVFHYSMAEFELGEIVHDEMRAVELPPNEDRLWSLLERKADLLLEAQRIYTRVIRIGHPHWAAAAAYRIGALYHHLQVDMLAAQPPLALSDEEREVYLELLRERTRVLLHKAVGQWERTLGLAVRLGLDNEWIARTTDDLRRIREELAIEAAESAREGE